MSESISCEQRSDQAGMRLPRFPWGRTWLLVLILTGVVVGSEEAFWRSRGFRPSVPESTHLWHFWRQRVYRDDGKVIVLLGTSRMQADICLDTLRDRHPGHRIVQLALSGPQGPISVLEDLANDQSFVGTVVCGCVTPHIQSSIWRTSSNEVNTCPRPSTYIDELSFLRLCEGLATLERRLRLPKTVEFISQHHTLPSAERYCRTKFDRSTVWEFKELADPGEHELETYRALYEQNPMPPAESFLDDCAVVDSLVEKLSRRGGQVAFVRLPSSGARRILEDEFHPKAPYWDLFSTATSATCVHWSDVTAMRGLHCPDGSHLGPHDAVKYTVALSASLRRTGVLP